MVLTSLQENGVTRSGCLDAELLASYVDGRTTPEQRVEVEAHLARCEDCYFAFSETVREQGAEATAVTKKSETPRRRGWWSTPVAAGLAAAAAVVVAVSVGSLNRTTPDGVSLQTALAELDAASGPYRKFESRLTLSTTHRELKPALRSSGATAEASDALREAALRVEKAATVFAAGVEGQRALATKYFALGQAQRAADVLAPLAQSNDAGVLSDVAAAYLARRADGDPEQAFNLLERAVALDPKRQEAWFNLGLAAEAARRPTRAREAWSRYLVLDPSSQWADEARWHLEKLKQ